MIKRYSRKELTDIWSEENKYKIWLNVEIAAAQAMEKLNQIPKGVSSTVRKKAKINNPKYKKRGYVWVGGHWKWSPFYQQYVWITGKWKKKKIGY